MSYNETTELIYIILNSPPNKARSLLAAILRKRLRREGEFYTGIIKHQSGLKLTTDQWFELLCRLPNRILRSGLNLESILSEEQLKRLPPVTG